MSNANLTQEIFIGVDGGATKTIVRAENASGQSLGQGQGGPANIRLSVEGSWQSINDALKEALASTGLRVDDGQHRFYCGAGLAGTEVTSACHHFLNTPHPFDQLILKSDGYTSCLGAHGGRDGALIAIGTGTVAFQIEGDKEYKAGGWGFPHGDEGSGAWLGLEAVRLTLHWLDGRDEPSPLLESVYAHFDDDLMRLVIWANQANATQFAQIAPLVIDHAKQKTPLALTLIKQAAVEVDRLASALSAQSQNKSLPCSLLGGLAQFIEPWLGDSLRSRLVGLRIGLGKWRAVDDSQSRSSSSFARNPQQIGRTMTANNPYRAFVDGFARLLIDAEALGSTPLTRPPQRPVAAGARTALIFAPHPDDEVIIGGLPLRLLRELKINVVNVAVTLGSRVDRQAARWQELKDCCDYIGFGLVAPAERGLEGINPLAKEKNPQGWSASVKAIAGLLTEHRPSIVFFPHDDDWNQTHIGVHRLIVEALGSSGFACHVVETEFWGAMDSPNLMVESSAAEVADLVAALSLHVGEVARNAYHLRLPGWMIDNVRRGAELVGGQGGTAPRFPFATLYRLRRWENGRFHHIFEGGQVLSSQDDLSKFF